MKNIMTAGLAMAALSAWPAPATSHDKHAHETWSAGEPGNAQTPSRTIEVEMSEMAYTPPAKSAEIVWKFTKAATFEYSCLIPDHRDFGMIGQIQVR